MQVIFVVMFYYLNDYELEQTFTFYYCFLVCSISISEGLFVGQRPPLYSLWKTLMDFSNVLLIMENVKVIQIIH